MAAPARCVRLCKRSWALCQTRCYSQVAANSASLGSEGENPLYPPIKPKYPPGRWGGMEPSYAWLWHKHQQENLAIPEVQDRIAALCETEKTQLVLRGKEFRPRTLDYKKYITKTRMISGLPDIYNTLDSTLLDELTSKLTPLICDLIVMENDQILRRQYLKKFKMAGDQHHREICHTLIHSIIYHLTPMLTANFPHLMASQYDENVNLSAFWDRDGITRKRKRMIHPDYYKFETVNDVCVTANTTVDFVLRTYDPLPEFTSRDVAPSVGEFPKLEYSPIVFGQKYQVKGKRSMEAGHVWGDPCEFGSLAVLNTVWARHAGVKYGPRHAEESRLGQGIVTAFIWLVAQAANQGFNTLNEMTYPLTTQVVMTDGQSWQFLAYQLNTLQLWKDDLANDHLNLCWLSPQVQLFDTVKDGKVLGFNPEVLKQFITCLGLAPATRPYNLRPTLPPTARRPHDGGDLIPMKKEKGEVLEEEKYVIE